MRKEKEELEILLSFSLRKQRLELPGPEGKDNGEYNYSQRKSLPLAHDPKEK